MGKLKLARRVAIIDGLRTPFTKMGTAFAKMSALDLASAAVGELVQRTDIDQSEIERVVYGQVAPSLTAPNIARELIFDAGLPRSIDAYSVSRACATSYQATADIAAAIADGEIDVGIAGGADSASDVPIGVSKPLAEALIRLSKARSIGDRVKAFKGISPRHLLPVPPALTERSTGLSMGQSAEKMAQENHISRGAQDEFAHRSHLRAAAAWADGRFAEEVMTVYPGPKYDKPQSIDNLVREDGNLDGYAKLRPVFDKKYGTITAGNSSPLTDGASAMMLMSAKKAKALGYEPLAHIRSYAFTALDPRGQMLMGPAYAVPEVLDQAGMTFEDLDLIDIHEAFAAQVLSVTQAWTSKSWAEEHLGRDRATAKELDWDKINVMGGSISLGHPFAATGTRQLTQTAKELRRRGGGVALCTACAAGGLGAAMILEVE